jgi:hypothetical protein
MLIFILFELVKESDLIQMQSVETVQPWWGLSSYGIVPPSRVVRPTAAVHTHGLPFTTGSTGKNSWLLGYGFTRDDVTTTGGNIFSEVARVVGRTNSRVYPHSPMGPIQPVRWSL